MGYSPQGCKESDTTERLHFHFQDGQQREKTRLRRQGKKESSHRKLALMSLGRQGRNGDVDIMNMWTQWGKKRVGQSEGVALAYTLPCVSRRLVGRCCGPQVALLDGL